MPKKKNSYKKFHERISKAETKKHDFTYYKERLSEELISNFNDIIRRNKMDNDASTAGAGAEQIWAELFKKWLPKGLIIETQVGYYFRMVLQVPNWILLF
ncbi:hypothetical protein [Aquimarina rubra]|uniref:Uncharacterized protein n=1 Tax=Aquimarina rubra TaxID=1920033 RepID=A0ABW5LH33_9FLAO